MKKALRIPGVLIATSSIIATSMSIGFLQATLEPHLRQFDLSPIVLGLMFVINGGTYAITAPAWGWLCDKHSHPKVIIEIPFLHTVNHPPGNFPRFLKNCPLASTRNFESSKWKFLLGSHRSRMHPRGHRIYPGRASTFHTMPNPSLDDDLRFGCSRFRHGCATGRQFHGRVEDVDVRLFAYIDDL